MKYAIIIPDGAADLPLAELDGKTPMQAADTPNMDWIATNGRIGTVRNVPKGMYAGSDVAIMSVLGYDPRRYYTGRAPIEAAAIGLELADDEWVFRCNLITIVDGMMEDYAAGHISTKEAAALIAELNRLLGGQHVKFHPGVSYRHLMTFKGSLDVQTTAPHDILGKPVQQFLPTGKGADLLRTIIDRSQSVLAGHEVNIVRRDLGENPASSVWLWGQGKMPQFPSFFSRFGVKGVAITAVDLVRGLAKLVGWSCIEVEGATGYIDTNYAGKGAAAVEALQNFDLVVVHVEAPDEAGHSANIGGKVAAIANIDQYVVGPVLRHLQRQGKDWRIMVLPDHPTPCSTRTHTSDAVPFAIAGKRMEGVVDGPFDEATAAKSDLHVNHGSELMEFFLTVR